MQLQDSQHAAFDAEELNADGLLQVRNDAVGGWTVLIVCRTARPVPSSCHEQAHSSLQGETQPLPERLDWWCLLQRAYLSAEMLIDPLAGNHRVVSNGKCFY